MEVPKEVGKHARDKIHAENDPYLSKKGLLEGSVCRDCTAVYQNKKWFLDAKLYEKKKASKDVAWVICPACKKTKENVPSGIVTLKGEFLKQHKQEIMNLVRNEEERSKNFNPLKRIMKILEKDDEVEIHTTSSKLAQRIGNIMHKAYNGNVEYKKHENAKFMRVEWER
ncbi:MAG: hypothetical protein MRJ65_03880 [Candidatus Brocadiaceae bacterium]|nr:hypothetical protein [Candidatus Brocadiaceae bacterium]